MDNGPIVSLFSGSMLMAFSAGMFVHQHLTASAQAEQVERVKADAQQEVERAKVEVQMAKLEAQMERRFVDVMVHADYDAWRARLGTVLNEHSKNK
ncbi:hypothetical protein CHLRE_16g682923v5 [Chlamydomonas reinhardtii]|uniref:Uncharacterized protein n=1 Tax=Chlamydomonas reinhardtii TaxID=3055 RepID=A0A2K3CW11_CHLRE|nr:uncharacterized protein CHLRE_16g682923v5 [Chlamydomonas reinhardtii]PNW72466.1 hypothetical protein CHLRE_16g682923v5 [Chlamydomonas reinhardtii]